MNPSLIAEAEVLRQQATTLLDYVPIVRAENVRYLKSLDISIQFPGIVSQWTDPMKLIHLRGVYARQFLTIQINMGDELLTVLSADSTGIREYHPGLWVDHFRMAYIEAEDEINAARKHRSESERRKQEARYAPVDDSGIFGRVK